ncbi:MAG TPA: PA2779 family protein [Wenzhouxiangellaceae bacterium]|nr:PA2779 family protein [Wenzhouxiangellaceae bacterium]
MIRHTIRNFMVLVLLAAMVLPANAQLVSTGDALALESGQLESRIEAFMLRDDVAAELAQYGISHEKAMARVANLSAAELEQVAGRINEMPAAGDGVVVIAGVVFIVLIILEVVGVTDIFKSV